MTPVNARRAGMILRQPGPDQGWDLIWDRCARELEQAQPGAPDPRRMLAETPASASTARVEPTLPAREVPTFSSFSTQT